MHTSDIHTCTGSTLWQAVHCVSHGIFNGISNTETVAKPFKISNTTTKQKKTYTCM